MDSEQKVFISATNRDVNDTLNQSVLAHINKRYSLESSVDLDEKSAGYVALATIKSVYDQLHTLREKVEKMTTEKSTSINDNQKRNPIAEY